MDFSALPNFLESPARQLFRRCLICPDEAPVCPTCVGSEVCTFIVGGCNACPSNLCIAPPGSASSSPSSPAGPIAGGVIGGIVLVIALVALLYFYYIKKHRGNQNWQSQIEDLRSIGAGEKTISGHQSFMDQRSKRQSAQSVATTKTSHSRQSNFIPIAYIPGVTSTAPASPGMVPPMPPIPAAATGTTSPHLAHGNEQFFMINDLRPESTYSHRKSYANSTARSSIAPSEYHDAIVENMPAARAVTGRAVPISVKSSSRVASPTGSPPLSHQNSIAGRMAGPQSGQAKQVMITRSQSNLQKGFAHEMEDTSPAPTPRIGLDRSGTASPRSMLSDDENLSVHRFAGGRSPGSPQGPVSAVRSEFSQSRSSPVSNYGWEHNSVRNTIRDAAMLAYGGQHTQTGPPSQHSGSQPLANIAELDGDTQSQNDPKSPFADRHATRTP